MFNALCNLADREQLLGDPAFEMKKVGWIVSLAEDGRLLGFLPTHTAPPQKAGSKKKPKPVAKQFLIPRQFNPRTGGTRTAGDFAYFLVDKLDYALGLEEGTVPGVAPEGKPLNRVTLFRDKINEAATATGEPALKAIVTFLDSVIGDGLTRPVPEDLKGNELIAFQVLPSAPRLAHDLDSVKSWWLARLQNAASSEAASELQCLVSGAPIVASGLFPKLKRVPGGQSAGAGLVSFNAPAFESYGFKKSENAPISSEAAQKVATALNRLLDPTFRRQDGELMPTRNQRLTGSSVLCYWSEQGAFEDQFGPALELHEVPEEDDAGEVGELAESHWRGRISAFVDNPDLFHAVTLSGAQGRVIVRDYFRTTVADLSRSMIAHFESLELAPVTRPGKGKNLPPLAPFSSLLESVVLGGKKDNIPDTLAPALLRSILLAGTDAGLPLPLVTRALERDRAEIYDDTWKASLRRDRRAAILKAFLVRNHNHFLSPEMQPKEHNPCYLCGRLLAAFGEMQRLSQHPRKINATIVDKFYGRAASTPQIVIGQLGVLYESHLRKALRNRSQNWISPKARTLQITIEKIYAALRIGDLPEKMTTEEQAFFVLGYQHQTRFQSLNKDQQIALLERLELDTQADDVLVHLPQPKEESQNA